ncbi:amidase [Pseudidiomarina sp. WS423]|uniref:amidase n=1 Tax=Pseudidiomarina sp. WS423 TaxID=3425124 RepID=UPI003D6F5A9C
MNYLSATTIANAIQAGDLTSTAITEHYLTRIEQHNPKLNAFIDTYRSQALVQAKQRDDNANRLGPLHGVPISIKECFLYQGTATTLNYPPLKNYQGSQTSPLVQRLLDAGAVILGKTNVPQLLADSQTFGPLYPTANNPFDVTRTPGGSTGGGAAALAADLCALELGSDIGGSIRNPAAYCGLFGLKPTENGHSHDGHVPPLPEHKLGFSVMNCTGPLARAPEDLELAYRVLYPDQQLKLEGRPLSGYTFGYFDNFHGLTAGQSVQLGLGKLKQLLVAQGATLKPVTIDKQLAAQVMELWAELFGFSIAQNLPWLIRKIFYMKFRPALRDSSLTLIPALKRGLSLDFKHLSRALYRRREVIAELNRSFAACDAVLSPTALGPAFQHNHQHQRIALDGEQIPYMDYCFPFVALYNLSGQPVLTVPSGCDELGLPIGISISAPHHHEGRLLHIGHLLAQNGVRFSPPELV